jgi:hypothetical protein
MSALLVPTDAGERPDSGDRHWQLPPFHTWPREEFLPHLNNTIHHFAELALKKIMLCKNEQIEQARD